MPINKTFFYYLILFAIFLFTFAFIPLLFEILQQKVTSNIPYTTLICMIISLIIYLYVTIIRKYYIHMFFFFISLICISIILYLKTIYDTNNYKISMYNNIFS
jgi:uncharacterized protein with PQ loop repeat